MPDAPPVLLRDIYTERDGFTLQIPHFIAPAGRIVCVVGPNGGGKTTLLLTILGLLPHRGSCLIHSESYDGTQPAIKAGMGFIPDDPELLFEELTAREHWDMMASVAQQYGMSRQSLAARAEQLAASLSFAPPARRIGQYSHGMRKKTQIVQALMGSPRVIVIDELRNGLDPIAIKQTETLIRSERARGAAIVAATHDLWWAERFADYIYIISHGNIVAHGELEALLAPGELHLEEAFFRIVSD